MNSTNPKRQNSLWSLVGCGERRAPARGLGERKVPRWLLAGVLFVAFATPPARAQSAKLQLGPLERLASKAEEVTEVSLDRQMLQLALNFMSKDGKARQLIQNLRGVYIRSYEFSKKGEYSPADVESILDQLRAARWQKVVSDRDIRTNALDEVYIMGREDAIHGLVIISAEPKELTVVNIVGPIDLRNLSGIEGHFGIPRVKLNHMKEESGQAEAPLVRPPDQR